MCDTKCVIFLINYKTIHYDKTHDIFWQSGKIKFKR